MLAHDDALLPLGVPLHDGGLVPDAAVDVERPALTMRVPGVGDPVLKADPRLDVVRHPAAGRVADPDVVRDSPRPREDDGLPVGRDPVDS